MAEGLIHGKFAQLGHRLCWLSFFWSSSAPSGCDSALKLGHDRFLHILPNLFLAIIVIWRNVISVTDSIVK
jgi:hypothetical protein